MTSGIRLALEAIDHDLSLAAADPEIPEIESLLVQTHQVWETVKGNTLRAGVLGTELVEPLLTAARQSLSNGDAAFALEDVRDAVDTLRHLVSPLSNTDCRDMK